MGPARTGYSSAHSDWSKVSFKLPPLRAAARLRQLMINTLCLAGSVGFGIYNKIFKILARSNGAAPHKILLIRRGGIGDFVMLTYLARSLKVNFPAARIYLLTGKQALALTAACPHIDEVLPVPKKWSDWLKLVRRLRREHIDTALVHHRFFVAPLLAWLCGVPRRIGFYWKRHGFALTSGIPFQASEPQVDETYRLVELLGGTKQTQDAGLLLRNEDIVACKSLLQSSGYDPSRVLIGMHVGGAEAVGNSEVTGHSATGDAVVAQTPIRRWPAKHFAQLADMLIERHNAQILIFQGPGDESAVKATLDSMVRKPFLIAPPMHILQFLALVSACDLVIAGDSGPMHIAVAFETPVLAIFGPTHPGHSGPVGSKHRIAWAGIACSPCWFSEEIAVAGKWNGKKMPQCWRQNHECMRVLLPETVYAIANEQLAVIADENAKKRLASAAKSI